MRFRFFRSIPADILAVMAMAFSVFSAYHAPQPITPSIQMEFGLSASTASLITTCVIFPLAVSPIFYGALLGRLPLLRTLGASLLIYFLALLPAPLQGGWGAVIAGRCVQGFALPACLLCLMTYVSTRYEGKDLQRYLGYYAFSTVFGGFAGRLFAGFIERATGEWRLSFAFMALCILLVMPLLRFLRKSEGRFKSFSFGGFREALRHKGFLRFLLIAPCLVLANNSVLAVLPFRLHDIDPGITALGVSIVYMGIILCSFTGLHTIGIISFFKTEMRALAASIIAFLAFYPLLLVPSPAAIFFILIGINVGYAFMYAALPGILNRIFPIEKSVINGAFLSFYYMGGALGTYLPVIIYEQAGFTIYLACMWCAALTALFILASLAGTAAIGKSLSEPGEGEHP